MIQPVEWLTITPHALARCLQRNGSLKISEIKQELLCTSALAAPMAVVAQRLGWKQVFINTPSGLFLGDFSTSGITIRTYIQPGRNGRFSKWDDVKRLLPEFPPDVVFRQEADLDSYTSALHAWFKAHGAEVGRHMSFQREPYERHADPLDGTWCATV